jgi:MFS family permease
MPGMTDARRLAALTPILVFTSAVVAVVSSLGAPLIPGISAHLHVPLSAAQWSLTITLLVGTISSPVMGRLADGPHRREIMIAGLSAVTLGGVAAALAPSLLVLVIGRGLQGIGLGLVPVTMAGARDHLPPERSRPTIALLSVVVSAGVGIGYPVSGLIAGTLGLSAAYWFGALSAPWPSRAWLRSCPPARTAPRPGPTSPAPCSSPRASPPCCSPSPTAKAGAGRHRRISACWPQPR